MPMETYTNSNTSVFRYCFRIRWIVSILQTSKYIRVTTANNNSNIRVSSLCVASVLKHDIAQKSRPVTFYSKLRELCQRGGILLTSNGNLFLGGNRFPYIRQWHLDIRDVRSSGDYRKGSSFILLASARQCKVLCCYLFSRTWNEILNAMVITCPMHGRISVVCYVLLNCQSYG